MLPVRLEAPLIQAIWAGEKLKRDYHKVTDAPRVAESWELSCHKRGESIVRDGRHAGKTLSEYLRAEGSEVLGSRYKGGYFPLLIKFIDSLTPLSLQVHPADAYAWEKEGEPGKTEMWYVLEAEEGSEMILGFARDVTPEEFRRSVAEGTVLSLVNHIPAKKGDVLFVPAGTIHGIGKGITVAEIQENSDITYRIHDYDRVGPDGKPRQLHLRQAEEVLCFQRGEICTEPAGTPVCSEHCESTLLTACEYFTVTRVKVWGDVLLQTGKESFAALTVTEGRGEILCGDWKLPVQKGDTVFVPANIKEYHFLGSGEFLLTGL